MSAQPDPHDPSQIEFLRSLDDGDGKVLSEVIDQYLAQAAEARGELLRVVHEGDSAAVERAAHLLKGASANIGANALATVCAEMETQSRLARLDEAAGLVERFDTEFSRVRDALTRLASTN